MARLVSWKGGVTLVALIALVGAGTGAGQAGPGGSLVITSYAPPWQDFLTKEILPGFERETGAKVELAVGLSRDWVAKMRVAGKNNPPYDVMIANTTWVSALRKEGFFAKLPADKVPNLADVWPEFRNKDDIGVLTIIGPLGIGYRTDLVPNPPKRWADLWRPEYKGKLGIYSIANSATPMFLMLLGRIFAKDDKNMDVAFQKVKELLPVRFSDFSGDMEKLLTTGEIHLGILGSADVARLKRQGVPVAWVPPIEGVFMFEQDTNVPEFAANKELAFRFVNYFLSVPVQEKWMRSYYWTPANRKVKVPRELEGDVPVHTQVQIRQIHRWDWDWVNAGARERMIERWNREIVGR
ncbi:MAG: ABC transporter substrate-binding protein [Armatimonadota bacterium]|nr:ABC transporter substrate-binding protein [Armatimonadota bacterium]